MKRYTIDEFRIFLETQVNFPAIFHNLTEDKIDAALDALLTDEDIFGNDARKEIPASSLGVFNQCYPAGLTKDELDTINS